jgi:hypothetical protein
VVRWLLDLLGKPMDKAKLDLGDPQQDPDLERYDSMERNLYYWLKGKTTPHVATIEEYFLDEAQPDFRGCFVMPEDLSESALLDAACQFVAKGLNADTLRDQIPMTQPGRIETILAGEASTEEVHEFARLLAIRYASPKWASSGNACVSPVPPRMPTGVWSTFCAPSNTPVPTPRKTRCCNCWA